MLARVVLLLVSVAGVAAVWALSCASKRFEHVAAGALPLQERRFERLTVVTVGTGGTFENHQRLGPAVAVALGRDVALVDAGRAVSEALRAAAIPVHQPQWLLLTSLLPENTLGLDDLVLTRALAADPEAPPLRIFGPPGTRALVAGLMASHAAGGRAQAAGLGALPSAEGADLEAPAGFRLGPLEVRAVTLPGGPLPALAYRLEAGQRAVVVSSAGWAPEALVELGRGARLWVHEALYGASLDAALEQGAERPEQLRREAALHTRLEAVGELARRMGVGTLVLSRLRPPPVYAFQYRRIVHQEFAGHVVIAEDGTELTP